MPPSPSDFAGVLVLTGPTGSGKSAVALELADRFDGEIVSADSMAIYRRMDIGTAKPTAEERCRVPHHMIDVLDPSQSGSVAWWLDRAHTAVVDIRSRGRRPIIVGGTPFFLAALQHGLFEGPEIDPSIRLRLEAETETLGAEALHRRLQAIDPSSAARLHPNDVRRVVRALEVFEATGQPLSVLQTTWDQPTEPMPIAVLDWPREELKARIARRVEAMLAAGWLDECRSLLDVELSREAGQALGYTELFAHLRGEIGLDEATERIVLRTRQFAKRQLTWFRGRLKGTFVSAAEPDLAERIDQVWRIAGAEL